MRRLVRAFASHIHIVWQLMKSRAKRDFLSPWIRQNGPLTETVMHIFDKRADPIKVVRWADGRTGGLMDGWIDR